MNQDQRLETTRRHVRGRLQNDASGHDWWHAYRVSQLARTIATQEGADAFICEAAALVHDLIDDKLNDDPARELHGLQSWLLETGYTENDVARITDIITTMSYKGGGQAKVGTLEAMVVQDADRLDAVGAIGIGRTFAFSGAKGQLMYDPDIPVRRTLTPEEYRTGKSTAINHFYEKLLKLQDLLNTVTARTIGSHRHAIMVQFLDEFHAEWRGDR